MIKCPNCGCWDHVTELPNGMYYNDVRLNRYICNNPSENFTKVCCTFWVEDGKGNRLKDLNGFLPPDENGGLDDG